MLYIYRASAGSGKTFLLTGFYIELLFRKELTPSLEGGSHLLFNEILAVTFTNKATTEMKERIVKDLDILWKEPKKSAYYRRLTQPDSHGKVLSDNEISTRAREVLGDMLNDYSNLHISTIDKFFQQVVRSFAHELNLQGNYEIELDNDMVLDHAVTQFLLQLDAKRDKESYQWIQKFSNSRLEQGNNWNIHRELYKLAKVLTTEEYRLHSREISEFTADKELLAAYIKMLDQVAQEWRKEMRRIGQDCMKWLNDRGLKHSDFKGSFTKKPFTLWIAAKASDIEKPSKTFLNNCETTEDWFKRDSPLHNRFSEDEKEELRRLMQEGVEHITGAPMRLYISAMAIRKNIFQLGILSQLEKEANEYCASQGVKLLADTTQMLNALVRDEQAPFIYEKTGTRIRSFMIDEFQDTSGMQWSNFSPLLRDSLAYGNRNLIVGDVKQSIYRWRGSDWELLHSHLNRFEPDKQAFDENQNKLRDNWRSDRRIVQFNNEFFTFASHYFLQNEPENPSLQKIQEIYSDVCQEISEQRVRQAQSKGLKDVADGEIVFETLDGEKTEDYKNSVQERLPQVVIALQQKGFRPKDILILCRKKDQCHDCAEALLNYRNDHPDMPYGMNIITEEALLLDSQPVIHALVAVLEYLREPKSAYRSCVAAICWRSLSAPTVERAISDYFEHPEELHFDELLNVPLYETVERLIAQLPRQAREQSAFLHAFCDVVLNFCSHEGPDLGEFLSWWEEHKKNLSVATPDNQDAIRIMTIHKSKGLDGEAVIIPFAMDALDIKTSGFNHDFLWCTPKEAPFARPNLVVPIELKKDLEQSIFRADYQEERIRCIIDNLNTAYVAFTRARHTMVLLAPKKLTKTGGYPLYELLQTFFENEWKEEITKLEVNPDFSPAPSSATSDDGDAALGLSEEALLPASEPDVMPHFDQRFNLPIIKKTDYIPPSDSAAARGTTLHAALSAVIDNEHVDEPITRLFQTGQAELQGFTLSEVLEQVHKALAMEQTKPWFNPANKVLNEQDIITATTHTQRPDRIVFTPDGRTIVIDYKTGEERNGRYKRQVGHYMNLLQEIGFQRIEGYIWYIETGNIVAVNPMLDVQK